MREYKGLKVPCEPKKEWDWMLSFNSICNEALPVEKDLIAYMQCTGDCAHCIYSYKHPREREQFYEETFKVPEKESFMEVFVRKAVKRNLPDLNMDTIPVEFVPKEKLSEGTLIGKWYNCIALVETDKGLVIRGTDSWIKKEEK